MLQVRGLPTLYFLSPDLNKDAIRTEGLIPIQMMRDIIDNELWNDWVNRSSLLSLQSSFSRSLKKKIIQELVSVEKIVNYLVSPWWYFMFDVCRWKKTEFRSLKLLIEFFPLPSLYLFQKQNYMMFGKYCQNVLDTKPSSEKPENVK